jgi:hypothetical protein
MLNLPIGKIRTFALALASAGSADMPQSRRPLARRLPSASNPVNPQSLPTLLPRLRAIHAG